ncbi:MAG: hypothetical protein A2431_02485 [Candidatus Zambryskibacteria bacterium RIFOXYC1_FULL_39_10]|uniref:CoA-binding domain-containing protein n=1 Tax=Candidatus Zambryskibacteria bacterium RIFOXYC1_FULL_39_10 TaxID=1802779 RepID=A0A1G2UY63_9BACT|nr:MAG: hypothetical protein A2431_02485 [Candidatus Zambryskibacteria bacterium RIFOXYC1_FULL_39_10]
MDKFFNPKSVAVIGASSDHKKVGFALVKNLSENKKIKVFSVNLENKEIPDDVDLAIIAVKAELVPQILEDCGKKQITNAIVISSGFKEMGPVGKELEDKVAAVAKQNNINLLGPNCLGIIDTKSDLNASFSPHKPLPGKIALLSQSGALGTAMLDWATGEGVGFSKFISLGNEAQLNEIDFLKYLKDDDDTDSILIYLEKVSDGGEFMRLVSEITKSKPVVILKAGVSEHGSKAVMSHTGSLVPSSMAFSGACKQAGAVTVSSLREFFNVAKLLSLGVKTNKPVQNLIILTNGGGPSVVAADLVDNSKSLSLVELNENTKEELKKVLPPMAAIGNPVDIIGDALSDRYEKALDVLCEVEEADGIIVMLTPQMMTEVEATAKLLMKYKNKKMILPVFMGGPSVQAGRVALIESGLVNFAFAKDVTEALDGLTSPPAPLLDAGEGRKKKTISDSIPTESLLHQMPFNDTSKILGDFNIFINGKFLKNKDELYNSLNEYGEGPYAIKMISPDIIHKTDLAAVALNIKNIEEAKKAWDQMHSINSKANIEGVLVQKMSAGREVIIGMKRDATFGPTILFGLGGILAEAIKDTTIRIAPISKDEALKMMQEIKGIKILQGMRGEPPVNFDLLADILVNLSRLALAHPEIKEIDLNPVMATDTSATIVDARVMM